MTHIPVLQEEVLKYLITGPNKNFVDATIGEGGHTIAILKKNEPDGKVLGIELDSGLYQELKLQMDKIPERLILVNDSYTNLKELIKKYNFKEIYGILLDLGMSSWHLEKSNRGFSFKRNEILDMRYNPKRQILTAANIINNWSQKEIERILKEYGQERFSKRIAGEIVEIRKKTPLRTTFQLVEIVKKATPLWYQRKRIYFATKTFQALRIAVNQEIENLKNVLPQTLEVLKSKGRLVIISFHSGEDRIVKKFFKENKKKGFLKILNKKPITASQEELKKNPRARSAKLRAAQKT